MSTNKRELLTKATVLGPEFVNALVIRLFSVSIWMDLRTERLKR